MKYNVSFHHLVSDLVFWSGEQVDGGEVSWSSIIIGQLRVDGLIGGLDLTQEVINQLIRTVFRHRFPMPVFLILNV